jgi:hypothetical protein
VGPASGEDDLATAVSDGSMPPSYYTWFRLNSDAKLSPSERDAVVAQLQALQDEGTPTGRR